MKIHLSTLFAVGICAIALPSTATKKQVDNRTPVRLAIRHADPWAVKAMLEGQSITQPELSTILGGQRGGPSGSGQNNRQGGTSPLLKDGYLVVNPTDNSLWWYPKKQS